MEDRLSDRNRNADRFSCSRNQRLNTDLIIKIGDKEIHAHRHVMAKKSEFFKALLSHNTLERQTGIVEMKDMELVALNMCIDSMYGKKIVISMEYLQPILHVASFMLLMDVLDDISRFLQNIADFNSFFRVRELATTYYLSDLMIVCDKIALENLGSLTKDPEFYEVDKQYLSTLLAGKKSIHPKCEDSKLAIILKWVNYDSENRKNAINELLDVISLSRVSNSYLKYILHNESVIYSRQDLIERLGIMNKLNDCSDIVPEPADISFDPNPNALLYPTSKFLLAYHPARDSFTQFGPEFPKYNGIQAVLATNDFVSLYVVSGPRQAWFSINMSEDHPRWMILPRMIANHGPAYRIGVALYDDHIYVVGNQCAERYSITKSKWSGIQQKGFHRPMVCKTSVVCSGFLYCFGENGEYGFKRNVEVHKLSLDRLEWSTVKPMKFARFRPKVVANGQCIYVTGSSVSGSMNIEYYDHVTGAWTLLTEIIYRYPELSLHHLSVRFLNQRLYITIRNRIESYDLEHKIWSTHTVKNTNMTHGCLAPSIFAPLVEEYVDCQEEDDDDGGLIAGVEEVRCQRRKKCVLF